jgi:hypothetical protein
VLDMGVIERSRGEKMCSFAGASWHANALDCLDSGGVPAGGRNKGVELCYT